jgi:hypothetical protein
MVRAKIMGVLVSGDGQGLRNEGKRKFNQFALSYYKGKTKFNQFGLSHYQGKRKFNQFGLSH